MGEPPMDWLVGAMVHVDVEEGVVTFTYTRDGSTFEVRYDAAPQ